MNFEQTFATIFKAPNPMAIINAPTASVIHASETIVLNHPFLAATNFVSLVKTLM